MFTGFSRLFQISRNMAVVLSIPATFATAFGFIFSYGKMLGAMAESKLLPSLMQRRDSHTNQPHAAIIAGSVLGYLICILVYFIPVVSDYLFNICILSAFFVYITQCVGFIHLRIIFHHLPREFWSPVGIPGAVVSILIWLLGIISVIGFQEDNVAIVVIVVVSVLFSVYYIAVAQRRQILSKDELAVMYFAKERDRLRLPFLLRVCECWCCCNFLFVLSMIAVCFSLLLCMLFSPMVLFHFLF